MSISKTYKHRKVAFITHSTLPRLVIEQGSWEIITNQELRGLQINSLEMIADIEWRNWSG
jgi:hypothetical protein